MKTVKDLLKVKGYDIWAVAPDASVYDALKLMADKNVGAVLVIEDYNASLRQGSVQAAGSEEFFNRRWLRCCTRRCMWLG